MQHRLTHARLALALALAVPVTGVVLAVPVTAQATVNPNTHPELTAAGEDCGPGFYAWSDYGYCKARKRLEFGTRPSFWRWLRSRF